MSGSASHSVKVVASWRWLPLLLFSLLAAAGCGDGAAKNPSDSTLDNRPTFSDIGVRLDSGPSSDSAPIEGDSAPATDSTAAPDGQSTSGPKNVTLVINLGDSLAAGYNASSGHGYWAQLESNDNARHPSYVGKDFARRYPGVKLVNRAKSGATTKDVVKQATGAPNNASGHTIVVVSAGGNDFNDDILGMVEPIKAAAVRATVVANLKKIIDHFNNKLLYPGGATIVLLTVHDPTDGSGNVPALPGLDGFCKTIQGPLGLLVGQAAIVNLVALDAEILKLDKHSGVRVVDNHAAFLGHGYHHGETNHPHYHNSDPTLWFSNDCAHLNDRGHHEVRRLIWRALFGE